MAITFLSAPPPIYVKVGGTRLYYDVALAVKAETEAGDIASAIDRLKLLGTLEPEDTNITAALATMKKMVPKPPTGR